MDVARCTADGKNYSVQAFEGLGDRIIENYRRLLVCPECSGPAFYRKESKSGQAACFGARPHDAKCSLAAFESKQGGGLGPNKEERINRGEKIEVDFAFGAHEVVHSNPLESDDPSARAGRFVGGRGRQTSVMHRRLSTLLKNLMHSEDFRASEQLIALPRGEFRVKDLFVDLISATEKADATYHGFWGMISDAGLSKDDSPSLWLNSGGRDAVSIVVDGKLSDEFLKRFPIKDIDDLAGAYVLVFGELRTSKTANKKRFIAVKDIAPITLSFED